MRTESALVRLKTYEPFVDYEKAVESINTQNVRIKVMIEKLEDQLERDTINNVFVGEFISSVRARIDAAIPLTARQVATLEGLFEQY
jgi:hypothetical protein